MKNNWTRRILGYFKYIIYIFMIEYQINVLQSINTNKLYIIISYNIMSKFININYKVD